MNVEQITDKQLYALNNNQFLKTAFGEEFAAEYNRRNFPTEYIEALNTGYEHLLPPKTALSLSGKIVTVLTACFFGFTMIGAIYFSKGSQVFQRQFWNWLVIGYIAWSV